MTCVAGLDPGRSKCGLVLVDVDAATVLRGMVLCTGAVLPTLNTWHQQTSIDLIVVGDGTGAKGWRERLHSLAPVRTVNERGTTLRARARFWSLWPARGWRALLPEGMRVPPGDLDAIAALVMVEEHLGITCQWPIPAPLFKSEPAP